jgi:hypothetical protein
MGRWADAFEARMRTRDTNDTVDTSSGNLPATGRSVSSVISVTVPKDRNEQAPDQRDEHVSPVSAVSRADDELHVASVGPSRSTLSYSSPQSTDAPTPVKRPVSWADATDEPAPGDSCSCCKGCRWWRETHKPTGWCCWTCHPPDHLPSERVTEART